MQKNFGLAAVGSHPKGRGVITLKRKCAGSRHGTRLNEAFRALRIIAQGMRLAVVRVQ
jgi:hypothetical protein